MNSGVNFDKNCWEFFYHQSPVPFINSVLSKRIIDQYFALSEFGKKKEKEK